MGGPVAGFGMVGGCDFVYSGRRNCIGSIHLPGEVFLLAQVHQILHAIKLTKSNWMSESPAGFLSDPLGTVDEAVSRWSKEQNLKREEQEKLERYRKEFLGMYRTSSRPQFLIFRATSIRFWTGPG